MKRKVEILAPAGSWECLEAAVCAGADAVYIGGSRFGARAHADNLNEERMLEAIDHEHSQTHRLRHHVHHTGHAYGGAASADGIVS